MKKSTLKMVTIKFTMGKNFLSVNCPKTFGFVQYFGLHTVTALVSPYVHISIMMVVFRSKQPCTLGVQSMLSKQMTQLIL